MDRGVWCVRRDQNNPRQPEKRKTIAMTGQCRAGQGREGQVGEECSRACVEVEQGKKERERGRGYIGPSAPYTSNFHKPHIQRHGKVGAFGEHGCCSGLEL